MESQIPTTPEHEQTESLQFTYDLSEDLLKRMSHQLFFAMMRNRLIIAGLCLSSLILNWLLMFFFVGMDNSLFIYGIPILIGFSLYVFLSNYVRNQRLVLTQIELLSDPRVELCVNHDEIRLKSVLGERRHTWNQVSRLVESRDFILLMKKDLPLMSIYKTPIPPEALALIRTRAGINLDQQRTSVTL